MSLVELTFANSNILKLWLIKVTHIPYIYWILPSMILLNVPLTLNLSYSWKSIDNNHLSYLSFYIFFNTKNNIIVDFKLYCKNLPLLFFNILLFFLPPTRWKKWVSWAKWDQITARLATIDYEPPSFWRPTRLFVCVWVCHSKYSFWLLINIPPLTVEFVPFYIFCLNNTPFQNSLFCAVSPNKVRFKCCHPSHLVFFIDKC